MTHSTFAKATFESLKAKMSFARVLLIPESGQDAKCVVPRDATKAGMTEVL
jgi:hypothetical protein